MASWLSSTIDVLLAVLGFTLIWYPMVSLGNAVLGSPVPTSTVNLIVGVLALGGAYPVVSGGWSLGHLGEFVFVLLASAIGWGVIGMLVVLSSGLLIAGSNRIPQAVVWSAAYLTVYIVVYRTTFRVFR